jgi:DNA-binding transcriptional ArsR family regulator
MEAAAEQVETDLQTVTSARRAGALLNPLRLQILALARQPASASDLARRLELPRQRINYHVRALERAGFLRAAGRRRKRNMIEQRYVASARGFVLSPTLLGPVGADWRDIGDTASGDYLLALAEQLRRDVERAEREAGGERVSTVSLKSQFRFESAAQRAEFTRALREAVVSVIARHATPNRTEDGRAGRGRAHRLVLACYPVAEGEGGS